MYCKIAIASGKGGTGKTTVAVNLYHFIQKYWSNNIQLIDCDVEEPNVVIFFPNINEIKEKNIYQQIPEIDIKKCTFCCKCFDYCEFNAIVIIPKVKFAEVNSELCHSCGACYVACQFEAIKKKPLHIGCITEYETKSGKGIIEGKLEIGSSMHTLVIKKLKEEIKYIDSITLFDAPPGTSCPVVATVHNADYVILVAEPTPFGLHDLKLTIEMLKEMNKSFGVIINKAGLGDKKLYTYLCDENIDILGEIPFNKEYASIYAKGNILENISDDIENRYKHILSILKQKIQQYA